MVRKSHFFAVITVTLFTGCGAVNPTVDTMNTNGANGRVAVNTANIANMASSSAGDTSVTTANVQHMASNATGGDAMIGNVNADVIHLGSGTGAGGTPLPQHINITGLSGLFSNDVFVVFKSASPLQCATSVCSCHLQYKAGQKPSLLDRINYPDLSAKQFPVVAYTGDGTAVACSGMNAKWVSGFNYYDYFVQDASGLHPVYTMDTATTIDDVKALLGS